MVSAADAVKARLHSRQRPSTLKLEAHHIPSPRLVAAIERMKRGEGIEYESVAALMRDVESLRKKKPVQ